jgi:hypothetical protein
MRDYELGAVLTPREMTEYALRHKLRDPWGIREEEEIKQTISYAADYWRLETLDLSEFAHVCDPDYRNKSAKADPIVHYFNTDRAGRSYCEVLDGMHRIGMARARGETTIRAWVGYDNVFGTEPDQPHREKASSASPTRIHSQAIRRRYAGR